MAYRRRQGITRAATFKEESLNDVSLAAQAVRAHHHNSKGGPIYDYTSMRSSNEAGAGSFWGVLARKAKAILDDDDNNNVVNVLSPQSRSQSNTILSDRDQQKVENPTLRKGLDAVTYIGNAFEDGRSTMVENKTSDLIKIQHMRRKDDQQPQDVQLKASRDVAMATAAKAKLLLRELKTVKADLAFAKERCSQLEEENKILREACEKGINPADDDMIRLQLETLLAEKARLAHENSQYARENRFLREIVEYHQLTMQDVVYLDEDIEEVTQVNPASRTLSAPSSSPISPTDISFSRNSSVTK